MLLVDHYSPLIVYSELVLLDEHINQQFSQVLMLKTIRTILLDVHDCSGGLMASCQLVTQGANHMTGWHGTTLCGMWSFYVSNSHHMTLAVCSSDMLVLELYYQKSIMLIGRDGIGDHVMLP